MKMELKLLGPGLAEGRPGGVEAATIPAWGESMENLATVIQQLRNERAQAERRREQLDQALEALTSVARRRATGGRRDRANVSAGRRAMSAAARKRIAAAQRARWAKWKAARKRK
jgi:hypothetical protein